MSSLTRLAHVKESDAQISPPPAHTATLRLDFQLQDGPPFTYIGDAGSAPRRKYTGDVRACLPILALRPRPGGMYGRPMHRDQLKDTGRVLQYNI